MVLSAKFEKKNTELIVLTMIIRLEVVDKCGHKWLILESDGL